MHAESPRKHVFSALSDGGGWGRAPISGERSAPRLPGPQSVLPHVRACIPTSLPTPSPHSLPLPARPRLAPTAQRSSLEQRCSSREHAGLVRARALHAHTCTGRAARDSGSNPQTDLRPCVVDTGVPLTASMIKALEFCDGSLQCDCGACVSPSALAPPSAPSPKSLQVPVPSGSVEVRDGVRSASPNVGCGKHAIVHCRTLCERRGHVIMSAHT